MKKGGFLKRGILPGAALALAMALILAGCNTSARSASGRAGQEAAENPVQAGEVQEKTSENSKNVADIPEAEAGNPGDAGDSAASAGPRSQAKTGNDASASVQTEGPDASLSESAGKSVRITDQSRSLDIPEGDDAVFSVEAEGDVESFQWQCRESEDQEWRKSLSPGNTEATLEIEGKKEYNGYQFRCLVTDRNGGIAESEPASLHVLAVTGQPKEESIKKGETATFVVRAQGRDLAYEWQILKPGAEEWVRYGNNTESVLKIKNAGTGGNGCRYRCQIRDAAGNRVYSEPALLYVRGFTLNPKEADIKAGGSAAFKVAAAGKDIVYQWQIMKPKEDKWENVGDRGRSKNQLNVENAGADSNGTKFRCKIIDGDGKKSYSRPATLYVFGLIRNPTTEYVKKGGTAYFEVDAAGRGLKYQWLRKRKTDAEWHGAQGKGDTTPLLAVTNAAASLHGTQYRCRITDAKGRRVYSRIAAMSVLSITKNPSNQNVSSGGTAVFRIAAKGSNLRYNWEVRQPSGSWRGSSSAGHSTNTLKVSTGTSRNGYRFRCKVTDPWGNTVYSKEAILYVPGITKNPTTQRVKAGSTAVFRVRASGQGLKYSWQVREGAGYSWRRSTSSGHTTNTLKVKASGSYHGYQFRCKVTDSKNRVFYSKAAALSVLGIYENPYDAYMDAGRTAVFHVGARGSGLKFQWQVKPVNGGWRNSSSTGNKTSTLKVRAQAGWDGYRFRCRVKDSKGNTVYSQSAYLWVYDSEQLFFETYE